MNQKCWCEEQYRTPNRRRLYVIDDPDELEIHQMQIEMKVKVPELEIIDAKAGFETHGDTHVHAF